MICKYCGQEIPDDAKSCPFCKRSLNGRRSYASSEKKKVEGPLNKRQKSIIISFGLAIVVAAIALIIGLVSKKTLDPFKGMTLKASGYDGMGEVQLAPDYDESEDYYFYYGGLDIVSFQEELGKLDIKGDYSKIYELQNALSSVDINYIFEEGKEPGKLSNGDKVVVAITYDKESLNDLRYRIKPTTKEFVVEGLQELDSVDLFNNVNLTWKKSYYDFYLEIEDNDKMPLPKDYYHCEELGNGEAMLTVDEHAVAANFGFKAHDGNYSKTIKVGSKPVSVTEINDDNRETIEYLANKVLEEVFITKCGWNLYGVDTELITTRELVNLEYRYGEMRAKFNVNTDKGNTYNKEFEFDVFIDSNGDYQYSTNYDDTACTISGKNWILY